MINLYHDPSDLNVPRRVIALLEGCDSSNYSSYTKVTDPKGSLVGGVHLWHHKVVEGDPTAAPGIYDKIQEMTQGEKDLIALPPPKVAHAEGTQVTGDDFIVTSVGSYEKVNGARVPTNPLTITGVSDPSKARGKITVVHETAIGGANKPKLRLREFSFATRTWKVISDEVELSDTGGTEPDVIEFFTNDDPAQGGGMYQLEADLVDALNSCTINCVSMSAERIYG